MPSLVAIDSWPLMARCSTLLIRKPTQAAFGRSSNQYGPGAYPQVKCVLLAECGSHAVVGLEMDRYDVSEVHGAYRLLSQVGPDMLVLVDAGLISGAFIEQVRDAQSACLGGLRSRRMGAAEHGSSLGRWLGVGVGGTCPFGPCPLSPAVRHVGAYHLLPRDRCALGRTRQGVSLGDDVPQSARGSSAAR